MADIDSQVSFSVMTESGETRSMTPEEINAFVRQQIELASSRKSSTTPTQQTRRMRLARTPSPLSRFGRTNPLLQTTTDSKPKNVDSIRTDLSLDESSRGGATTTPRHRLSSTSFHSPPQMIQHVRPTTNSTGLVQTMSPIHLRESMEDEKRSLSVDRQRQSISPDRRDGVEEKRDSPVEFDFDSGRKTLMEEKQPRKESELRIEIFPTSPKKAAPSPEYSGGRPEASFSRHEEPVTIRRRSPSQTDRKLKKAARNKASRRRADLFTATRTSAFDSEPFDENDQYSQISDTPATLFDSSMEVSQKTHESLKDAREVVTPREKKKLMSQPEIDILIKHSINKARKARKVGATELERKEKQLKYFEPKSRFDELTGMSPLGGKNRRFSWSSVEDLDDVSTLDGTKSPKAALEVNGSHAYHEKADITYGTTTRSDMLTALSSTKLLHDQVSPTESGLASKPRDILVPGSSIAAKEENTVIGNGSVKKLPEGLTISTEPSPHDLLSPLNIPSITSDRIYSQDEISAIVLLSMEKAQQAARNEIRSLLLTPKANDPKSPIAAKLAARLRVPSQEEVTSIAREAMHRAREAAQDEIRTLIRESFRCAQDSSQEQIRQIVRDSMQRARASAREEMSELVRNILRQGINTQQKNYHKAVTSERNPDMIAAEKLLASKGSDRAAIGSFAGASSRPSQENAPKLERRENEGSEEKQNETATSLAAGNGPITEENGGAMVFSTALPSTNTCEHRLTSSVSESEKSIGLDTGRTPKTKFSFSQVDTQDEDQHPLPESHPHSQPVQEESSPNSQPLPLQDTRVHSVPADSVSLGTRVYASENVAGDDNCETTPTGESNSCNQTTDTSSMTKQPDNETSGNQIAYRHLSPERIDNQVDTAIKDGDRGDDGDAPGKRPLQPSDGPVSSVEIADNHACEAIAADSSMIALNDGPSLSLSVPEETPIESRRRSDQTTERKNALRRRKSRAVRTRYVSGMKSPSSSTTPSDASTHSSCSASADVESTTSSDSQFRQKSRKNRYRSSKNEAVVTDEFLQLIASKKGKRITAKDLGELIKQQQEINSPHSKNDSRLRKRSGTRGSQSFQARPHASFEKQPRFCMVGNFMNFWEDLDLFLEEEGSDYHGNEILSFSTRGGSYTEFEDDDIDESFTEEARFDPNIAVSFSLQRSEEDESFVSEEEEAPKRRGWW